MTRVVAEKHPASKDLGCAWNVGDQSLIDAYVNALSVNAHLAERIWYLWRHGHICDEVALATWGLPAETENDRHRGATGRRALKRFQ